MNKSSQKLFNKIIHLISKKNKTAADWVKLVPIVLAAFGIMFPTVFDINTTQEQDFPDIPEKSCSTKKIPKQSTIYKNCTVTKIYDGDTVTLNCGQKTKKVRMVGIDAPEMQQEPWGKKSQQALSQFIGAQHVDFIEEDMDMYARSLGVIRVKNESANLYMVKSGYAVAYDNRNTAKEYCEAENSARSQKLGIWAIKGWHQDPKGWRKHKK